MEERNVRNKIIAISGQPVTGKGTNVKAMVKKLEQRGYKTENIHVIATGDQFRKYFNVIIDFIKNINNEEKLKKLAQLEELKEIFSNEEYRAIFAKTIKNLRDSGIDFSNFSIEQANNMPELDNIRKIVDTLIDKNIENKGKEINQISRPDEIWIIDSRLAFHNIPSAFSVRLTANADVAAKRLFNDTQRGQEDSKYKSIEEAKEAREKRRLGENERYLKRYGVDLANPDNYDLIIDTSYSTIDDISDTILNCLEYYQEGKDFTKTWTNPKLLLPTQNERETLGRAMYSLEELIESINKYGYIPSESIEIVEVDGYKYIREGHHRNFASAYLGRTLVPYLTVAKDDELIPTTNFTAREMSKGTTKNKLYGHEGFFKGDFSYNEVYPNIYQKLSKELEER